HAWVEHGGRVLEGGAASPAAYRAVPLLLLEGRSDRPPIPYPGSIGAPGEPAEPPRLTPRRPSPSPSLDASSSFEAVPSTTRQRYQGSESSPADGI
ncbi:MAG: hypothetical protein MI919_14965, partial [Holophagales bacterium]|nr:hypothetical protein [Holophagales bacterium]